MQSKERLAMCKRGRLPMSGPSCSGRLIYVPKEVASPSTAFDRNSGRNWVSLPVPEGE